MYKTWNVVDYIVVLNSNGNLQPWSYTDSCDSSWHIKIPRKRGTNWLKRNVQQEQGLSKGRARRPRQIQFSLRFQSKFNPGLHFFKSSHCLCCKFNNTLQRRIIFFFRDFGMPQHTNSAGFLTLFKKPLNPCPAPPFEHCKKNCTIGILGHPSLVFHLWSSQWCIRLRGQGSVLGHCSIDHIVPIRSYPPT